MKERIIQILQEVLELDGESINLELNPVEDLKMDSISIVNLIVHIEEEFGCDFEEFDELNQHMQTVEEMVEFLMKMCRKKKVEDE